uniref:Thioesterase in siderophore biosynthesis gene cluster n=1 Tax=Nonomuraea gerenzanensis TaxID=93944 RepID=A0A1M4E1J7_9ACTN|nr:Thioesterase in siderophore biosynthesis gene cluster [Nonomuraea gerenzanensis]
MAAHDRGRLAHRVAPASEEALIDRLRLLGGTDAEALASAEFRAFALPYVRNDFQLVQSYRHTPGPPLTVPITAFTGADDPVVRLDAVARWAELTAREFSCHVLPGGHFFLGHEQAALWAHLHARLGIATPAHCG